MAEDKSSLFSKPLPRRDPYRLAGEIFSGRYLLEEFAGAGSFGAVYRARHTGIDRAVAIKILKPDLGEQEEMARELFQREARTAGRLQHRHIVAVTDVGEENGIAYLVMEWLEGRSLDEEMKERGPFSPEKTAALLAQIAEGLHYAHEKGVIHRDIKPSNIHLGEADVIKVLDFGIAKILDSSSAATASRIAGTTAYMAPEQILGEQIDRRTDIYALGVMLFQMLAGQLPFGGTKEALRQHHLSTVPRKLDEVRPDLPEQLSAVIQKALAKKPEERQPTALELHEQFTKAVKPTLVTNVRAEGSSLTGGAVEKGASASQRSGWEKTQVDDEIKAQSNASEKPPETETKIRKPRSGFLSRVKRPKPSKIGLALDSAPAPALPRKAPRRLGFAELLESIPEKKGPSPKWTSRRILITVLWTALQAGALLTAFYVLNYIWGWCTPTFGLFITQSSLAVTGSAGFSILLSNMEEVITDDLRNFKWYSQYSRVKNPRTYMLRQMLKLCGLSSFFGFAIIFMATLWSSFSCGSALPGIGLLYSLVGAGALIGFIFCGAAFLLEIHRLTRRDNVVR